MYEKGPPQFIKIIYLNALNDRDKVAHFFPEGISDHNTGKECTPE
jgi:hypothetical protein